MLAGGLAQCQIAVLCSLVAAFGVPCWLWCRSSHCSVPGSTWITAREVWHRCCVWAVLSGQVGTPGELQSKGLGPGMSLCRSRSSPRGTGTWGCVHVGTGHPEVSDNSTPGQVLLEVSGCGHVHPAKAVPPKGLWPKDKSMLEKGHLRASGAVG